MNHCICVSRAVASSRGPVGVEKRPLRAEGPVREVEANEFDRESSSGPSLRSTVAIYTPVRITYLSVLDDDDFVKR